MLKMRSTLGAFLALALIPSCGDSQPSKPLNTILDARKMRADEVGVPIDMILNVTDKITIALVFIPAGKYLKGSPLSEKDRLPDETQKPVAIEQPFYIGKYEITQNQYAAVMSSNPSLYLSADAPVETVSWEMAKQFCEKLSALTSQTIALPSENQWEYACRAETTTPFCAGTTAEDLNSVAWFRENTHERTQPVGQKRPNAWGLYDMHGNVWEWCEDPGPGEGERILKGGSWMDAPEFCRCAARTKLRQNVITPNVGFRVIAAINVKNKNNH